MEMVMDIRKSITVADGYFHDMENEEEIGEGIQIFLEAIGKRRYKYIENRKKSRFTIP